MGNKIWALLIVFITPIILFFAVDYLDVLQIAGRKNQPKLKRYIPIPESTDKVKGYKANDTLWHTIPNFSFDGHNGKKINLSTFNDKVFIADFFFTHCPSICPKMSKQLQRVQYEFKKDESVMFLSHTVDPARDSVEVLKRYANLFEADSTRWHFVTGSKKELYDQARNGYFITATEGDGGDEDFVHSEKLVLVDKYKVIRGFYDGTDPNDVNQLMIDIKVLQLEYPRERRPGSVPIGGHAKS